MAHCIQYCIQLRMPHFLIFCTVCVNLGTLMQPEPCPSMEAIFEQGGFGFKETVATEDPLEKSGEIE